MIKTNLRIFGHPANIYWLNRYLVQQFTLWIAIDRTFLPHSLKGYYRHKEIRICINEDNYGIYFANNNANHKVIFKSYTNLTDLVEFIAYHFFNLT